MAKTKYRTFLVVVQLLMSKGCYYAIPLFLVDCACTNCFIMKYKVNLWLSEQFGLIKN